MALACLLALWGKAAGADGGSGLTRISRLPNGLRVITREEHGRPLVAVAAFIDGGSRTETPELSGLSHYYEHLIFRGGSERQPEQAWRRAMTALGDELGYTTEDYTTYGFVVHKQSADEALWRLADAMLGFRLTPEKVERERRVVLEEFHMRVTDSASGTAWVNLLGKAFQVHPYGRDVIGIQEVLEKAAYDDLRTFYEERYVPNQMVLGAVGDFDTAELLAKIEKEFGKYPAGKESFELELSEPEQRAFREIVVPGKVEQSYLYLGFHVRETRHRDTVGLDVLSTLLGYGNSSRLYRALKYDRHLVTNVSSYLVFRKDPSLFVVQLELPVENEEPAMRTVWSEIRKLAEEPPSEEELQRTKQEIETAVDFATESYASQAERLCEFATKADLLDELTYLDRVRAVQPEEIRALARQYLRPSNATLSLVRPQSAQLRSFTELAHEAEGSFPKTAATSVEGRLQRRILPNGIPLVLRRDPGAKTIALAASVRGGLWSEPPEQNGIAYLTSQMLAWGTKKRSGQQLTEMLQSLGIQMHLTSGKDYSQLSFSFSPRVAEEALALFREVLWEPSFPEEELTKVRADQLEQIRAVEDDTFELGSREFLELLYGKHPYGRSVLGRKGTVSTLTSKDLAAYHARTYVPANLALALCGRLEQASMGERLAELLGQGDRGDASAVGVSEAGVSPAGAARTVEKDLSQSAVFWGRQIPSARSKEFWALQVATKVLGLELFFRYVYDEGIAYRVWTRTSMAAGPGALWFELGVSPGNLPRMLEGLEKDVRKFVEGPAGPLEAGTAGQEEFERAKGSLIQNFLLELETPQAAASRILEGEVLGLGGGWVEEYPRWIEAVTSEQAVAAARQYFDLSGYCRVLVGKRPPEK